jgi:predicted DNA-binding transcriptional regulator AlpA
VNPIPPLPRYVGEHEAAQVLGFSVSTLQNWRSSRRGPAYLKCGRSVRYLLSDLISWIEKGRVERGG